MKTITLMLLFALLGYSISKPLGPQAASDGLVEIEKQRLIKFPEDLDHPAILEDKENHDEANRILQEIRKINQALGYLTKQPNQEKPPAILDSAQYLFPNVGYQPFHVQSSVANSEALILPSTRSVKFAPLDRKSDKGNGVTAVNSFYFKPLQDPEKIVSNHFVIPVRLYKQNKQHYLEKNNPKEYKIKGYKIVGDIEHFYGKTKLNRTAGLNAVNKWPKYHLFFLPEKVLPKNNLKVKASEEVSVSKENNSREEKLAHRPYKVETNTQALTHGNTVNATSSSQIVKKRLVPKKGANTNSVITASSSTVVKLPPTNSGGGQQQQQQHQTQQQQQHYLKPVAIQQTIQTPPATPAYAVLNNNNNHLPKPNPNQIIKNPVRPLLSFSANNNNSNAMKNRPLMELQNNINSINNATSNAIKTAFQNIFRLPFRQPDTTKPSAAAEFLTTEMMPLAKPQQQQYFTAMDPLSPQQQQVQSQSLYVDENFQSDQIDSDYKWEDENLSLDSSNSESQEHQNPNHEIIEAEEKKIFSNLLKHKLETQKEALKQGGIIIQKLKVRKGGIAIAGPGGVATAGSGGTAIVGPGGYALTHPRSLTIAGPGAKVIAIPSNVDLKEALQRTNLELQTFPREGRIVATGPTVYYAPPTGDYVEA